MQSRAQVALEFLLVFGALIATMLALAPVFSAVLSRALQAIDDARAKIFASELENSLQKLSVFSDDSKLTIIAEPLSEWKLSFKDNKARIFTNKKEFLITSQIDFAYAIDFSISKRACVVLKRLANKVYISLKDC
ncbi:MAG: hypothetical protein J7J87_00985 [Candidatus Diapherotrites archaeon]|nr:hypothetical protein [Candidatus Diapherotrites archaeon]